MLQEINQTKDEDTAEDQEMTFGNVVSDVNTQPEMYLNDENSPTMRVENRDGGFGSAFNALVCGNN